MIILPFTRRSAAAALLLAMTGGCSNLLPGTTSPPAFHVLEAGPGSAPASRVGPSRQPTLIVTPTHAAPGFDSQHIIYRREAGRLEYFAQSEWIDTPARMLAPLLVAALESDAVYRAVLASPKSASGELRLDTELLRLEHDFSSRPSRVRFVLRAYLVDGATRQVIAWREFDESREAASEDARGGVLAANQAIHAALEALAAFCGERAGEWQLARAEAGSGQ
ncbi:MAG: ABC-type transport auxiliary lipoprotein family protein [Azonexus sp.]